MFRCACRINNGGSCRGTIVHHYNRHTPPWNTIEVTFGCIPPAASLAVSQKSTKSDVTGPAREPGRWRFDVQNIIATHLLVIYYNSIHFLGMKLPWSIYSTPTKLGYFYPATGVLTRFNERNHQALREKSASTCKQLMMR